MALFISKPDSNYLLLLSRVMLIVCFARCSFHMNMLKKI